MKDFYIDFEEIRKVTVKVTAESYEEAKRKVELAYEEDKLEFDDYLEISTEDVTNEFQVFETLPSYLFQKI